MKRPVAYYLLLIYATVMFNPLIPLIQDAVSHTFAEAYHIATVHAKYGNNHLEKEIASTSEGQTKNQSTNKTEEIFSVHLFAEKIEQLSTTGFKISYPFLNAANIPTIFLNITLPPPKFI